MKPAPTHPAVTPERTTTKDCFIAVCMVAVIGLMIYAATLLYQTNASPVSDSPPTNVYGSFGMSVASPIVFPPYPTFPSRIEMIMIEPTLTPTSVVPTKVPTQSPFLCPLNPNTLPNGETCLGPPAPLPTPLPMPTCQATPVPAVLCEVRDSVVKE